MSDASISTQYDLLIQNVTVLNATYAGIDLKQNVDIAVSGDQIVAIEAELNADHAAQVVDGAGMLATPGMINCHSHIAMSLLRGVAEDVSEQDWFNKYIWPIETGMNGDDVYYGAMLGMAEMIEAGVTTFSDHYFLIDHIAKGVEETGLRAVLAPTIFSNENELAQLDESIAFAETWQGAAGGRVSVVLGPHAPYTCTPEFLKAVADKAKGAELGIHIHLSETLGQVALSKEQTGRTPVDHLRNLGLFDVPLLAGHLAHPVEDDLSIIKDHGVTVACTPKTEMKMAAGVTPVVDMRARDIPVGLGTDGAASNDNFDILEAARVIALLEKYSRKDATILPMHEALALGTSEAARTLWMGDKIGTLAVGKQADIVLRKLDRTHIVPSHSVAAGLLYSSQASDVDSVFVAGKALYRGGKHLTLDVDHIKSECRTRAQRLASNVGDGRMAYYPA